MYKVLLVDDDPLVLVQLRKMIDWDRLDCELTAEAANGEEAILAIDRYRPQIVITDISMPGISGVDLIQYINKRGGNVQVIAISAFDDFCYVRGSLKGGAGDYLLKHQLTQKQLEEAILGAVSKLDQKGENRLTYSVQEKKEYLLYQLLHTGISERDLQSLEELNLGWLRGGIVLALGSIPGLADDENREVAFVLMDETIKYYHDYQILPLEKGLFLILFRADEKEQKELGAIAEQIQRNLKRFCDMDPSFVISDSVLGYGEIPGTLERCVDILEAYYFRGKQPFLAYFQEQCGTAQCHLTPEQEEILLEKICDGEEVEALFDRLFLECGIEACSRNQIQFFFVELISVLMRRLENLPDGEKELFSDRDVYEEFFSMETAEEMKRYLVDQYQTLQRLIIQTNKLAGCGEVVREAVRYIEQNYRRRISLADVSRELSVSPSYLSRIFKKDMGVNIVNYVNQIKMEKARELMSEGKLSMNEIALELGIQNYNYFYTLFKEIYGITPSDYVKNKKNSDRKRTK